MSDARHRDARRSPAEFVRMTAPIRAGTVLLAAGAILFLSIGARQGFGLLMEPAMRAGLTRDDFSLAVATQYLVWGLTGPLAGLAADRWGSRVTLVAGGLSYACGFVLASFAATALSFWWAAGILIGLGLGGASFGVVHAAVLRVVPMERRGRALGLVGAATAIGQLVMLGFTFTTIGALGWREALLWHGGAVALICVAAQFLDHGPRPHDEPARGAGAEPLEQALRTAGFWLVVLPFACSGFQVMATMTHLPAMASDMGLGKDAAFASLLAVTGSAFLGQLVFGALADRFPVHKVLAAVYAARAALSCVPLAATMSAHGSVAFFFLLGLVWMSPIPLASAITARLFGTRHLGAIFSLVFFFHQLGGFAGTWLASAVREAAGTYAAVWLIAALLCLHASVATLYLAGSMRRAHATGE